MDRSLGVPVSEIQVNQSTWRPENRQYSQRGDTSFLPKGSAESPQLRKIERARNGVLQRQILRIGIVSLNDVRGSEFTIASLTRMRIE